MWIDNVREIYGDYYSRIDADSWKEILAKPDASEYELMCFLEEHSNIPADIAKVVWDRFGFADRVDELFCQYNPQFIQTTFVDKLHKGDEVDFSFFEVLDDEGNELEPLEGNEMAEAVDEYFENYLKLKMLVLGRNGDETLDHISEMNHSVVTHPQTFKVLFNAFLIMGRLEEAEEMCEYLDMYYGEDADYLSDKARVMWEQDKDEEAYEAVMASKDCGGNLWADNILGDILTSWGKYADAEECYSSILSKATSQIVVNKRAGVCKKIAYALEARREELDEEQLFRLADMYMKANLDKKAKAVVDELGDSFRAVKARAVLARKGGDLDEARELIIEAGGIASDDHEAADAMRLLANVLKDQGEYKEAETAMKRAIELEPDSVGHKEFIVALMLQNREYEELLEIADQVIDEQYDSFGALFAKGKALYELGRYREAVGALSRATNIRNNDLRTTYVYTKALLEIGNVEDAAGQVGRFPVKKAPIEMEYIKALYVKASNPEFSIEKQLCKLVSKLEKVPAKMLEHESEECGEIFWRCARTIYKEGGGRSAGDKVKKEALSYINRGRKKDPTYHRFDALEKEITGE